MAHEKVSQWTAGLNFEKPILELEQRIHELKTFSEEKKIDLSLEIDTLAQKLEKLKKEIYEHLTPWQRVQIARHPRRPYTLDYISLITTDFLEIHGDRCYGDDKALLCGFAQLDSRRIVVIGHQKGRDTKENICRNFGCANPEGYRKAIRVMRLAERFHLPIVIFIDTPGAYPGIGAEERGQALAIAENLRDMVEVRVPIICTVIGEGGSGGALGVGVTDRILILENAYYSVISPEGCAAILWKTATAADKAAESLKLTGFDLQQLGIVDEIVPEPVGGAHRDYRLAADNLKKALQKHLNQLDRVGIEEILEKRYQKFRTIGVFSE